MTNMSIQPLWLTHFIEILLVLEFQLTKFIVGAFSYKAHFRPQISSNAYHYFLYIVQNGLIVQKYHKYKNGASSLQNTHELYKMST